MPEVNDGAREFPQAIISKTSTITFENDKAYASIKPEYGDTGYQEELDEFIKGSTVNPTLGENGSLLYERADHSKIIIPNKDLQALKFVNSVIEREKRDNILSETEIIAKNKARQLEDASKNLRDWSNTQFKDIYWEDNRVKIDGGKINLSGSTLIKALQDPDIVGKKVRIHYENSKGKESIYYFSLVQADKIIDLSNTPTLATTKHKISILKREIPSLEFETPLIRNGTIVTPMYNIPAIFLEDRYQIHREITENGDSFTVSLYVKGSGGEYKLQFSLDDYNRLLNKTS